MQKFADMQQKIVGNDKSIQVNVENFDRPTRNGSYNPESGDININSGSYIFDDALRVFNTLYHEGIHKTQFETDPESSFHEEQFRIFQHNDPRNGMYASFYSGKDDRTEAERRFDFVRYLNNPVEKDAKESGYNFQDDLREKLDAEQ